MHYVPVGPPPVKLGAIPSLAWPLIWLGFTTLGFVVCCLTLLTGDLGSLPSLAIYGPATWALKRFYYDRRIAQRAAWRRQRLEHFILHVELPPAPRSVGLGVSLKDEVPAAR